MLYLDAGQRIFNVLRLDKNWSIFTYLKGLILGYWRKRLINAKISNTIKHLKWYSKFFFVFAVGVHRRNVLENCPFKNWSQFFFGSWRNKLKKVVHTVQPTKQVTQGCAPHFWVYFEWTEQKIVINSYKFIPN